MVNEITKKLKIILISKKTSEAYGGVMVKTLRYKPAGRGFDSR
jgi:hypothetical protein